jgi:hypothetical protein
MNASIDITFVKEIQNDNSYKINGSTSNNVEISSKIFVLKILDNSFTRVASELELDEIPEAPTNGWNEYRSQAFQKVFTSEEKAKALDFIEGIIGVTDRLLSNINSEEFEGTDVVQFPLM